MGASFLDSSHIAIYEVMFEGTILTIIDAKRDNTYSVIHIARY